MNSRSGRLSVLAVSALAPACLTLPLLLNGCGSSNDTTSSAELKAKALQMTDVTAQIILRAPDGSSPLESEGPPSAQSRPTEEAVENATRELKALGFTVGERGAVSLTVSADRATFERVFSTTLTQATHSRTGTPYWSPESPPRISEDLRPWVADVVFPIEPEFMP